MYKNNNKFLESKMSNEEVNTQICSHLPQKANNAGTMDGILFNIYLLLFKSQGNDILYSFIHFQNYNQLRASHYDTIHDVI